MHEAGTAMMGVGEGAGEKRAIEAAKAAITSPLIAEQIDGAKGLLLNITGGEDLGLFEVSEAAELISSAADARANIVFGSVIDAAMTEEVRVTVIATGFESGIEWHRRAPMQIEKEARKSLEAFPRRRDRGDRAPGSGDRDRDRGFDREPVDRDLVIGDADIDVPDFLK
jgi:cell division protein FtsZ